MYAGFATRYCNADQIWDVDTLIDVSQCQSIELLNILNALRLTSSNTTLDELNDIVININRSLNFTSSPIFPLDLQNTNNILNAIIRYAYYMYMFKQTH